MTRRRITRVWSPVPYRDVPATLVAAALVLLALAAIVILALGALFHG